MDGRWVNYGLLSGGKIAETLEFDKFLRKRVNLHFSTLRNRDDDYKAQLVKSFIHNIIPKFDDKHLKPIVDKVFYVEDIHKAHEYMEENKNIGKIIVTWNKH